MLKEIFLILKESSISKKVFNPIFFRIMIYHLRRRVKKKKKNKKKKYKKLRHPRRNNEGRKLKSNTRLLQRQKRSLKLLAETNLPGSASFVVLIFYYFLLQLLVPGYMKHHNINWSGNSFSYVYNISLSPLFRYL